MSSVDQTSPISSPGLLAPLEISVFREAGRSFSSCAEYMGARSSRPQIFGLKTVESWRGVFSVDMFHSYLGEERSHTSQPLVDMLH